MSAFYPLGGRGHQKQTAFFTVFMNKTNKQPNTYFQYTTRLNYLRWYWATTFKANFSRSNKVKLANCLSSPIYVGLGPQFCRVNIFTKLKFFITSSTAHIHSHTAGEIILKSFKNLSLVNFASVKGLIWDRFACIRRRFLAEVTFQGVKVALRRN